MTDATVRHTDAFMELETPIRDLELMAQIAIDKAIAVDTGDSDSEMLMFAVKQVQEMAAQLVRDYDRLWNGVAQAVFAPPGAPPRF